MSYVVAAGAFGAAMMAIAGAVSAASVVNYDQIERKFTMIVGEQRRDYTLEAGQTLQQVCESGCLIVMQDGMRIDLDGQEIAAIEEGKMFVDGYLYEAATSAKLVDVVAPKQLQ